MWPRKHLNRDGAQELRLDAYVVVDLTEPLCETTLRGVERMAALGVDGVGLLAGLCVGKCLAWCFK